MAGVFPLTFTAWEEFLVTEDLPGCRKTFVLELSLDGEADRGALDAGIDQAVLRHPLLGATMERRFFGRPRWIISPTNRPRVDWGPLEMPVEYPEMGRIDLTQEVGVRFYVRVGGGRSRIHILFHHACCDGYGAIQFLSDFFAGYVRYIAPSSSPLPAYWRAEPEKLVRRADVSPCIPPGMGIWRFIWTIFALWLRLVFRQPAELEIPESAAGAGNGERLTFPGNLTQTFDQKVYRSLRRLARRKNVTVNDLLIRELLIAAREWNLKHASAASLKRLGIVIPINLRNLDHDGIPAANVMGLAFLNHSVNACDDPERLLRSIHEECEFVKNSRFASTIPMWFDLFRRIPGLLSWLRSGTFGTMLLSNIGDPWRAVAGDYPLDQDGDPILGNLVLKDVNSVSPMAARTRAAFTVWQACDKLRIGLRCQPSLFTLTGARALLDLYASRILALTETSTLDQHIKSAA